MFPISKSLMANEMNQGEMSRAGQLESEISGGSDGDGDLSGDAVVEERAVSEKVSADQQ